MAARDRTVRLLSIAIVCVASATPAMASADPPLPGRLVSASLGVTVNPSLGHAATTPPGLLQVAPEFQLAFGMQLAEQVIVITRLDFLGAMIPLGPAGYGLDLGVAWTSALRRRGWGPLFRFTAGGLMFQGGGEELGLGPSYQGYGFRLALEGGVAYASRRNERQLLWSLLAGVHASGLPHVEPCDPGYDCSDVLIGPTLRGEVAWLF